jgi:hypothetical protein
MNESGSAQYKALAIEAHRFMKQLDASETNYQELLVRTDDASVNLNQKFTVGSHEYITWTAASNFQTHH